MRFEKWQALGNDYLIVEQAELPFELTARARPQAVCRPLRRVRRRHPVACAICRIHASWRICASTTPTARRPSFRATARARRSSTCAGAGGQIKTSSRSRPPLARYAPRSPAQTPVAWTWAMRASHPRISRADRATVRRARRRRSRLELSARVDRQSPVRHPRRGSGDVERTGLAEHRPRNRSARAVPKPHERVVVHGGRAQRRRGGRAMRSARAFSSVAWERRSPPVPAPPAPLWPTACTAGHEQVTVLLDGGELSVEVGEDLHVNLTGWARPVFAGELSEDFIKELYETE